MTLITQVKLVSHFFLGFCSKNEFLKTISKIGITGFSDENLLEIFTIYDTDKSGELDYKELIGGVFNNSSISNERKSPTKKAVQETEPLTKQEYIDTDE